jgi:hypothetical protein
MESVWLNKKSGVSCSVSLPSANSNTCLRRLRTSTGPSTDITAIGQPREASFATPRWHPPESTAGPDGDAGVGGASAPDASPAASSGFGSRTHWVPWQTYPDAHLLVVAYADLQDDPAQVFDAQLRFEPSALTSVVLSLHVVPTNAHSPVRALRSVPPAQSDGLPQRVAQRFPSSSQA